MAETYQQLQKRIAALQRQADKLREQEVGGVVARIKTAIAHYGLSAEQLGFGPAAETSKSKAGAPASLSTAKYSDGQGRTWSGRGPRPYWLRDALKEGKALEDFASAPATVAKKSTQAKVAKKRKSGTLYRDQAGHTWSGMGPRPRWLREALEAGQTLEQLAA
jgi:DNA-binding protein H-NS